jgi:integrase
MMLGPGFRIPGDARKDHTAGGAAVPKGHPKLCHHKGRELGYVTAEGKEVYFRGKWPRGQRNPPADVRRQYDEWMADWHRLRSTGQVKVETDPSVDELWLWYHGYAKQKYRKNGKQTSEFPCVCAACRIVARLYGDLPARKFGVSELERVREEFVAQGWERNYLNQQVSRVRRMFREGARRKLFPSAVWLDLKTLEDVRKGQGLPEAEPVEEVPDEVILATLPALPSTLRALVQAHRLIGCRADEACLMRTCDLRLDADPDDVPEAERCWLYTPSSSKTDESYWVGPQAQAVLRPLLRPDNPAAWLFPTRRRGRGCWHTSSYRRAVTRALARLNAARAKDGLPPLPHWTPLMVRHRAGEEARRRHPKGLEATQARLRHSELRTSEIYAHDLDTLGRDVAR